MYFSSRNPQIEEKNLFIHV